jgi:CRISPR/Cas system CSM-associated protein Csm2 small subunit
MNYYHNNKGGKNKHPNNKNEENQKFVCKLENLNLENFEEDYDKTKEIINTVDNFFKNSNKKAITYRKMRKYYDKILKTLSKYKNKENLKSKLETEVGILIDYDMGRESNKELECVRKFFDKTLTLIEEGKNVEKNTEKFEKIWEVFIAYARKNLREK